MQKSSRRSPHTAQKPVVSPYEFPIKLIDQDAFYIVKRLQSFGYLAYFVGGCVRDALLGKAPKDFDIVTSARPREVRGVFRNAQLIGRRFKLAHLHFPENKVLEVATFRQPPSRDSIQDGVIVEDNEYGTPETDAYRRDFTINALFYDPLKSVIIDYTGGLADVERLVIRSIGDPKVRFREDPIRMLRAIKFAARLDLNFDDQVKEAMRGERESLVEAARPRLQQELVRFLQGGSALRSFELLIEFRYLQLMSPELHAWMNHDPNGAQSLSQLLGSHDQHTRTLWPQPAREDRVLSVIFWPWVSSLVLSSTPTERLQNTANEEPLPPLKLRDLKMLMIRLLAPTATRIGMSIKGLHAISRILSAQVIHQLRSEGMMMYRGGQSFKGEVSFESLLLLKSRYHAGLASEEEWREVEEQWRQTLAEQQKRPGKSKGQSRLLIPKKPVVKPTKKRPRRSRSS